MTGVVLGRHVTLETVQLEQFTGIDGEGAPAYNSPIDIDVRAVRKDKVIAQADGSMLNTELTLWIPAAEATMPEKRDRVTQDSGMFIVAQVKDVNGCNAQRVHRRVRCRRE